MLRLLIINCAFAINILLQLLQDGVHGTHDEIYEELEESSIRSELETANVGSG